MAKQMALFLFIGVLAVSASASFSSTTCGEDEMDLCVDSTDIKSNVCGEDEMDLCMDIPQCDEDEMDLCVDLPSAPTAQVCAEDEMDLCQDYETPSICAEDEMDLCVDYVPPQAPTPSPTPAPLVTFKGTLTFTVDGHVEKVEVEMAAKRTIELSLPAGSEVFVTATQSRRLDSAMRRLSQSSWSVAWQADVPETSAMQAETSLEAFETDNAGFQTEFKKQLIAVGCDVAVAESMEVKSFQSEKVVINSSNVTEIENTDSAMGLSGKFSIIIAIMVSSFMSPSLKPLGLLADILGVPVSEAQ